MDEPPSHSETGKGAQLYLSDLIGAAIRSGDRRIGRVKDIVALVESPESAPALHGIVARVGSQSLHFVPAARITELAAGSVTLATDYVNALPFERRAGEMLLAKDLRDKEVVHVEGKRVVRANDILLEFEGDRWVIAGIDVSAVALLNQIGLGRLTRNRIQREVLPWSEVEIFEEGVAVPLHLSHGKISRLHPSDIARVFHELGYRQSSELLDDLPNGIAADVVEDLSPEYQATLLASLDRDRAADILEEMPPDAAADVLNDILEEDPEAADELVQSMESDEAAQVEKLRGYRDDTAGGVMTVDFVTMPAGFSAGQALQTLKARREDLPPSIDPIFVVTGLGSRRLAGVLRLADLVLADPDRLLDQIMDADPVVRHVHDAAREAARTIAHYNLVALPILDDDEELVGVVPINEAMDLVLPREWLNRSPRSFIGGRSV